MHPRLLLTLLSICAVLPAAEDWYRFTGQGLPPADSLIACDEWLQASGRLDQRISRQEDRLLLDGEPVKLWGINTNFGANAPDRQTAERRAAFFARYGFNLVRLHKLTGAGWAGFGDPASALRFDPEGLDNFDYQNHQYREHGIRYAFSAVFKLRVGPEDRDRIPFFDEAFQVKKRGGVKGDAYGLICASPALQDLLIEQMVKLLKHENPHTGLTYAEDPALAWIETINEENAYFYSIMGAVLKVPTLKRSFARRFSQWLEDRYGSQAELEAAWGDGLDGFGDKSYPNENLADGNIFPVGNPWFFDPEQLEGSQKKFRQRFLDTMAFFHHIQVDFFQRFQAACREAGYEGLFVTTNWQAGTGPSHYWNLHSDTVGDIIDRHNYFGGKESVDKAMVAFPGGGLLSTGMQQVAGHPFLLSEWAHVAPNPYAGEGPAIVAAYGMGLQGWDAATIFSQRRGGTNEVAESLMHSPWDVGKPQVITLYPALSRMVLRGDVQEAALIGRLPVSMQELQQGELAFETTVQQEHDLKAFSTDAVPTGSLAIGRVAVDFVDEPQSPDAVDPDQHREDGALVSTTGQLRWHPGQNATDGHFTIDTDATKAAIGFLPAEPIELNGCTITPRRAGFQIIIVTPLEADADLATSKQVLVTAVARARHRGLPVDADKKQIEKAQTPPIEMEPVAARIELGSDRFTRAVVLDHDGRPTDTQAPMQGAVLDMDTGRDQSMYILLKP